MHQSPSDSKICMKVEEDDAMKIAPSDKSPKKKSKEDKGKSIDIGEFTHIPTIPHVPYPSVLVGRNNRASSKDREARVIRSKGCFNTRQLEPKGSGLSIENLFEIVAPRQDSKSQENLIQRRESA
ncbi:hypothetical protein PIB30_084240 [Stylosanthes scabra]|uniref:Uncharacterized protein n=1 Tax=Stylosanthes scabra TaxID=79078 RepID=A0ABU6VSV3_9FABA|nr:hypothetical protein [Stylosanthes scabra]